MEATAQECPVSAQSSSPSPPEPLSGLSSMATRALLAELAAQWQQQGGVAQHIISMGGVDAARRVRAGEAFDWVLLAADAIEGLIGDGHLAAGSRVDLLRSPVAVAVRAGSPRPGIDTADALRQALQAALRIGHSTGPSGSYMAALCTRWGLAERLVQAPPGVPVGQLLARGEVDIAFQQLSELLHLDGIALLGPLPAEVAHTTTFAAGLGLTTARGAQARAFLDFIRSPQAEAARRRHGMEAA